MANVVDDFIKSARTSNQSQQTPQNGSKTNEEIARELIAQAGGDGKKAFVDLCKARGLDPMSFISQHLGGIL